MYLKEVVGFLHLNIHIFFSHVSIFSQQINRICCIQYTICNTLITPLALTSIMHFAPFSPYTHNIDNIGMYNRSVSLFSNTVGPTPSRFNSYL